MMDDRNDTQPQADTGPKNGQKPPMMPEDMNRESGVVFAVAKYPIGLPVQHRRFGFQGVIFDVDPEFDNTEEWYQSIPEEVRPKKEQPFYHLFAVNPEDQSPYIAYVSEQNLEPSADEEGPFHPAVAEYFAGMEEGRFVLRMPLN
jgi:heat shock protein HspQ